MIFTIRDNSYIGTTIVVPDMKIEAGKRALVYEDPDPEARRVAEAWLDQEVDRPYT